MPAMEHRAGNEIFQRPKLPIQVGVHERRGENVERHQDAEHCRRDAGEQQHDVDQHGAEAQVHRMEPRR